MPRKRSLCDISNFDDDGEAQENMPLAKARGKRSTAMPKRFQEKPTAEYCLVQFTDHHQCLKVCSEKEIRRAENGTSKTFEAKWNGSWFTAIPLQVHHDRSVLEKEHERRSKELRSASSSLGLTVNNKKSTRMESVEKKLLEELATSPGDIDGDSELMDDRSVLEKEHERRSKELPSASTSLVLTVNNKKSTRIESVEKKLLEELATSPGDIEGDPELMEIDGESDDEGIHAESNSKQKVPRADVHQSKQRVPRAEEAQSKQNAERKNGNNEMVGGALRGAMDAVNGYFDGDHIDLSNHSITALQRENSQLANEVASLRKENEELQDNNISLLSQIGDLQASLDEAHQRLSHIQHQEQEEMQGPPAPGLVPVELATQFCMVEVVPASRVYAYPGTLTKINRLKTPTRMCRALLRMLVDPARINEYTSLKQVDVKFVDAAIEYTLQKFKDKNAEKSAKELQRDLRNIFTCNNSNKKYRETGIYPKSHPSFKKTDGRAGNDSESA